MKPANFASDSKGATAPAPTNCGPDPGASRQQPRTLSRRSAVTPFLRRGSLKGLTPNRQGQCSRNVGTQEHRRSVKIQLRSC